MNVKKIANTLGYWFRRAPLESLVWVVFNSLCNKLQKKSPPMPAKIRKQRPRFYIRGGTSDLATFRVTFLDDEYGSVISQLKMASTIVDLGANIGDSAVLFAEAYEGAHIIAVEPDLGNLAMCKKNIESIKASSRVSLHHGFVGSKAGVSGIDRSGGEWAFKAAPPEDGEEGIPVVTMTTLIQQYKLDQIDLLKVDIEGGEMELFESCAEWINSVRAIVIETEPPYSIERLLGDLERNRASFRISWEASPDNYHQLAFLEKLDD